MWRVIFSRRGVLAGNLFTVGLERSILCIASNLRIAIDSKGPNLSDAVYFANKSPNCVSFPLHSDQEA